MAKMYKNMSPAEKKAAEWEDENLMEDYGYLIPYKKPAKLKSVVNNVMSRGYDAARVSPQITTKNGYKYRKVFGAVIEYKGRVQWHEVGYIREKRAKAGTTPRESIRNLAKDYGLTESYLKSALMIK